MLDVGTVEHPIHVELCFAFAIGVNDMRPVANRNPAGSADITAREVAIHLNVWRTAELHHDFALSLFVAPGNQRCVRSLGTEPNFGGVGVRAGGIVQNLVSAEDALAAGQMPSCTDNALCGRRACVCAGQRAGIVAHRIVHVPNAEIAIRFIEDRLAIGLAGRIRVAPMQLDLLPRIPRDQRHAHPDASETLRSIPLFNLKREPLAGGRRKP